MDFLNNTMIMSFHTHEQEGDVEYEWSVCVVNWNNNQWMDGFCGLECQINSNINQTKERNNHHTMIVIHTHTHTFCDGNGD